MIAKFIRDSISHKTAIFNVNAKQSFEPWTHFPTGQQASSLVVQYFIIIVPTLQLYKFHFRYNNRTFKV